MVLAQLPVATKNLDFTMVRSYKLGSYTLTAFVLEADCFEIVNLHIGHLLFQLGADGFGDRVL